MKNTNKELMFQGFVQREYGLTHPTYDTELKFYHQVQSGAVNELNALIDPNFIREIITPERGVLSDNEIRNIKYHIIITAAMVSRFCIEGGLDEKVSYGLSDIYIKRVDEAKDVDSLAKIHKELVLDYAKRMKKVNITKRLPIHCVRAMDYISDNIQRNVTVAEVSEYVGLDRTYFSKLFKKETGQNISTYIMCKKIQTAQNMLLYSEFSCADIAQYLGFASHSHFTENFKNYSGLTPTEYRKRYYRKHWTK